MCHNLVSVKYYRLLLKSIWIWSFQQQLLISIYRLSELVLTATVVCYYVLQKWKDRRESLQSDGVVLLRNNGRGLMEACGIGFRPTVRLSLIISSNCRWIGESETEKWENSICLQNLYIKRSSCLRWFRPWPLPQPLPYYIVYITLSLCTLLSLLDFRGC